MSTLADAQHLPFGDAVFDAVTVAFGLGNDLAIVSQVTGKGQGEIGCTTTDIEETRAGRYPADGDYLLAPVVMQAKTQHRVEDIIMLGNGGKHLPHSISHSLPLLLTSDIFIRQEPPYYGQSQEPSATPLGSGIPLSALHRCKENHTTICTMWEEPRNSEGFYTVLLLGGSDGGIARTEKEVQKLKLKLHCSEKAAM